MAGGTLAQLFQGIFLGRLKSKIGGQKLGNFLARVRQEDLDFLKEQLQAGTIVSAIDKRYPFRQTPEALRYLGEGHVRGKVVINLESG